MQSEPSVYTRYLIRFGNGDTGHAHRLQDGRHACIYCGEPWPYPQYTPVDSDRADDVSEFHMGDVCERCEVELGVDDHIADHNPPGHQQRMTAYHRWKYLDRVGWSREALDLIRENLGLSEDDVRQGIVEMRAVWNV